MKSTATTQASTETQIQKAYEDLLGALEAGQALQATLDVLLWARWIPSSEGELIGYFDAMRSLADSNDWDCIQAGIAKRSGTPAPSAKGVVGTKPAIIERLRSALLPIARTVHGGDRQQCNVVIKALLNLQSKKRDGDGWGGSSSMIHLWEALLADYPGQALACLFPAGVAAAPALGMDHQLMLSIANPGQKAWILGLQSLYPDAVPPKSLEEQHRWDLAIAAPPWGEKTRELLERDPWLPPISFDCPSVIRDSEARRVYAAHQRCNGTTYALVSAGVGFRTSRDLEFFREDIIRNNWLDAVIALPAGAIGGSPAKGLLLVLKKDRTMDAPVLLISAEDLLRQKKVRGTNPGWNPDAVSRLSAILHKRRDSAHARLVDTQELERNGFSLQVSRYLHSEADLQLQRYLESRETMQLGDLAEIKRPLAGSAEPEDGGVEVREVAPPDIDDSGLLRQGSKLVRVPEAALARGRQQLLEAGDVLLSIKGGLGRAALVQELDQPTVPGQAFCVIRLRPRAPLSPTALVQYLRSAVGQTLLNKAGQDTGVGFVPMGEVKALPVVIPSAKELQRADAVEQESVALSKEVEDLSRRLTELSRHGWMEDLPTTLVTSAVESSV